jgi:hypothetical protein
MMQNSHRFAGVAWLALAIDGLAIFANAAEPPKVVSKTLFLPAPPDGAIWAKTFYTEAAHGPAKREMMCLKTIERKSDIPEQMQQRRSPDNGKTWSAWEPAGLREKTPQGVHYVSPCPAWVDPVNGWMLQFVCEAVLPHDEAPEYSKYGTLHYRVSTDGGRTFVVPTRQVIQSGEQYNASHPIEGVWVGKNTLYAQPHSCVHTRGDKVLVPVEIPPIDANGNLALLGGSWDYANAAVLVGTWNADKTIRWDLSHLVMADPTKTTRGFSEPTIAEMPDGRILMVMRGSNDVKPSLPGWKWHSISTDGGVNWSPAKPWTYSDGSSFFSPSSCSQLLQHSNGRRYWIGNIWPTNPKGNEPRHLLVIGEVDPGNLLLMKDTVTVIDTKGPGDPGNVQLSNFLVHEDRASHEIVMDLTRFYVAGPYRGDALTCRIAVNAGGKPTSQGVNQP